MKTSYWNQQDCAEAAFLNTLLTRWGWSRSGRRAAPEQAPRQSRIDSRTDRGSRERRTRLGGGSRPGGGATDAQINGALRDGVSP